MDKSLEEVKALIRRMLEEKIANYSPEGESKPFFDAIFNKKQISTATIVQSFYTSFGMSAYEQISCILAKGAGFHAERQYNLLGA